MFKVALLREGKSKKKRIKKQVLFCLSLRLRYLYTEIIYQ